MNKSRMVVADMYQLGRIGEGFSLDLKGSPERTDVVVTREWAEQCNENYAIGGKWYDIKEDQTEIYYSSKGKYKTLSADVVEEVFEIEENPKLERAKADYEELYGKKPFHSWNYEKIVEKINEKINE